VRFLERYLGISPDGADGSFELIFIAALFTFIAAIALRLLTISKAKEVLGGPKRTNGD
jgi:hypothetical protein